MQPPKVPAYLSVCKLTGIMFWHIWCPYCAMWHFHRAGEGEEDPKAYLGVKKANCLSRLTTFSYTDYELVYGGELDSLPDEVRDGPLGWPPERMVPLPGLEPLPYPDSPYEALREAEACGYFADRCTVPFAGATRDWIKRCEAAAEPEVTIMLQGQRALVLLNTGPAGFMIPPWACNELNWLVWRMAEKRLAGKKRSCYAFTFYAHAVETNYAAGLAKEFLRIGREIVAKGEFPFKPSKVSYPIVPED